MKLLGHLLLLCIVMPIWFYLLYQILKAINATELTWFLFWVYFPVTIFSSILVKLAEGKE